VDEYRAARWYFFQTKHPNLGKFWSGLKWKMSENFMAIWNILRPFGTFYGHLVRWWQFGIFSLFWYIVSRKIWQPWTYTERVAKNSTSHPHQKLYIEITWMSFGEKIFRLFFIFHSIVAKKYPGSLEPQKCYRVLSLINNTSFKEH
jgi:hypothetical protein